MQLSLPSPNPGVAAHARFFANPPPYVLTAPIARFKMDPPPPSPPAAPSALDPTARFAPDEEAARRPPAPPLRARTNTRQRLLAAAAQQKASGNTLFATAHPRAAIDAYTLALASTPAYCAHETAVLHSNLAACHLRLDAPGAARAHAAAACARRDRKSVV